MTHGRRISQAGRGNRQDLAKMKEKERTNSLNNYFIQSIGSILGGSIYSRTWIKVNQCRYEWWIGLLFCCCYLRGILLQVRLVLFNRLKQSIREKKRYIKKAIIIIIIIIIIITATSRGRENGRDKPIVGFSLPLTGGTHFTWFTY